MFVEGLDRIFRNLIFLKCKNNNGIMHFEVIKIKIAIISDIHGNSVALKEIIKDAEKNKVNEYIFLGDQVNDLPFGNETLDIVKKYSNKVLKGNKEQYLIEYDKERYNWKNVQFKNTLFMYNELTKENLKYIKELPHFMKLEYDGVKLLIAHGSPKSVEEQLHRNRTDLINKYTENLEEDALIFGHTHEKVWKETVNNKLVISCGCSGVSPFFIGQAEYVILEINNGKIDDIISRLVNFDINLIKKKIITSGILNEDKVFMNLTYGAISGHGVMRHNFLMEAKEIMLERNGKLYKDNAKGIFKYFKLYDDDIWLGLAEKYKNEFIF